jgi:glycosyltransferase involved in cell wall biosynthesis
LNGEKAALSHKEITNEDNDNGIHLVSGDISSYQLPRPTNTSGIDLSIIIPVFNEEEVLGIFHHELCKVLAQMLQQRIEIIYINDGSSDGSWQLIRDLTCHFADLVRINLSRNFGKEAAMTAGFDVARGAAITILDADLQDPPELLPQMLAKLHEGYDVVNMKRHRRRGESFIKTFCAAQYYKLFQRLSDTPVPTEVGDFRMLSRRVVTQIRQLNERSRYMKGLMSWPGYKQTTILFDRPKRKAGKTKWSFVQLVLLALSGITAFSVKPLRLATILGTLLSCSAFAYGMWVLIKTMLFGDPVAGYPSLVLIFLFMGGVQLIAIGIVGEYVGRIFIESKGRPNYLIMDSNSTPAQNAHRIDSGNTVFREVRHHG